jgi:4-amino-4-deoxy-L-arabinose transferase-like glycosyltransferase
MPESTMSRARKALSDNRKVLVFSIFAAIVLYSLVTSLLFAEGPAYFGDDTTYLGLAHYITSGSFVESEYIFSIRLLMIFPIAMFYELFGVSILTSAAWDITAFVGTVIVTFYLGRELYNDTVGLLAALLFAFFPLVVSLSTTISDNIPLMFFGALTMLALLRAEKRNSRKWYFATGVLALATFLTTPEGAIIDVVVIFYSMVKAAMLLIKRQPGIMNYVFILAGIAVAVLLLVTYNYINSGFPFITFGLTNHYFSALDQPGTTTAINSDLGYYFGVMFPYSAVFALTSSITKMSLVPISYLVSTYFNDYNMVGVYFYACVIALIYLAFRKEKRAYYPAYWFLFTFLYLQFGPMHLALSPLSYQVMHRLTRFLTILAVPLVLVLAIAINRMLEKQGKWRLLSSAAAVAAVIFIIATAIPISMQWNAITKYQTYDQIQIADYLNAMPNTTKIYFETGFSNVQSYMRFDNLSRFYAYDNIENCSAIPGNVYVIVPKVYKAFNLNYTPNPTAYCPDWTLVLYPKISGNYSQDVIGPSIPFLADLYHVPA